MEDTNSDIESRNSLATCLILNETYVVYSKYRSK